MHALLIARIRQNCIRNCALFLVNDEKEEAADILTEERINAENSIPTNSEIIPVLTDGTFSYLLLTLCYTHIQ